MQINFIPFYIFTYSLFLLFFFVVVFFVFSVVFSTCGSAFWTSFWFVNETFFCIKFLFSGSKNEFTAAIFTNKRFILVHDMFS